MSLVEDDNLLFRSARPEELASLIDLLLDDAIGQSREILDSPNLEDYRKAFMAIEQDPNNELLVVEMSGALVGCLQLTFIPGLSRRGSWRAQIESVRVRSDLRGKGIGRAFFLWAIERAKARGCRLVQLTSDKHRSEALKFYESLGFTASHEGFKRQLP